MSASIFIETMSMAGPIPVSDIIGVSRVIHPTDGKAEVRHIRLRSGSPVTVFDWEWTSISREAAVQIMPAQPGFEIVRIYLKAEPPRYELAPLVGWALCLDGKIRPLGPTGVQNETIHVLCYIRTADGRVCSTEPGWDFDDFGSLLAHYKLVPMAPQSEEAFDADR